MSYARTIPESTAHSLAVQGDSGTPQGDFKLCKEATTKEGQQAKTGRKAARGMKKAAPVYSGAVIMLRMRFSDFTNELHYLFLGFDFGLTRHCLL